MIRYPVTEAQLRSMINDLSGTWLLRAQQKTDEFRAAHAYVDHKAFWSAIKPVYLSVQRSKCAYCERKLEGPPEGYIEHDIEHFRPKNGVKRWPSTRIARELHLNYPFSLGDAFAEGYYLLAYHPLNYVTACKVCNTRMKGGYFPIAGSRMPGQDDPSHLVAEQPFLLYPLGDLDADPQEIIAFDGWLAVPKQPAGPEHQRARVIIDFFRLNLRDELIQGRIRMMLLVFPYLKTYYALSDGAERDLAGEVINLSESPGAPHSSCVRSFHALYQRDAVRAADLMAEAVAYLKSHL